MKLETYIKLQIREILRKFGLKLQKLTETEKFIRKITDIRDQNLKYKLLLDNKEKFSHSPKFHLLLAMSMNTFGNPEKYLHLDKYSETRKQWLSDIGLDKLNMEFIPSCRFTGSLGNHAPVQDIIEANFTNLRDQKRLFVLLDKKIPLRNKSFFNYFKPYIEIIEDDDLILNLKDLSSILEVGLQYCVPLRDSTPNILTAANIIQTKKIKDNFKKLFYLSEEDLSRGRKILASMGIPKDAWYVTLHCRDVGYRKETHSNSKDTYRNTTIDSYFESIKFIKDCGGWVFRMGDSSMKNLPEIKNCIDYANSEFKSEFMDVYLGATSRFNIASESGYLHIPLLFDVPIIFTNSPVFENYYNLRKNNIYLPRLLARQKTKEIVKFNEFMSLPFGILNTNASIDKYNLNVVHNSPDEIMEATKEMFMITENLNIVSKLSDKQQKFSNLAEKNSIFYINKSKLTPHAQISKYFLDKREGLI